MNKINYQLELDKLIENIKDLDKVPTLLLHSCCAPCSSYVITYLNNYFKITVLYYNPNIYPEEEYEHRLSEQIRLIKELNKSLPENRWIDFIDSEYFHEEFIDYVKGLENEREGGARCSSCFKLRLQKTYELAKDNQFDYYATTLTVSPHKNAMLINSIGYEIVDKNHGDAFAANEYAIWLPSDFKKREGYKQSIEISKNYDLYRQNYCGCEFSIYSQ